MPATISWIDEPGSQPSDAERDQPGPDRARHSDEPARRVAAATGTAAPPRQNTIANEAPTASAAPTR